MTQTVDPVAQPADPYPYPYAYEVVPPNRFAAFVLRLYARSPRWAAPLAALGCVAGATSYVMLSNPVDAGADAIPSCLVKLTTGFDCPGCGGTRAAWYLLHGDVSAAARHHLMFVFAVPFLIYAYVAWAAGQAFGWKIPQLRVGPTAIGVFLAAWGVFSVLRNLPWSPFTWFFV
jgi:hypothetical protein